MKHTRKIARVGAVTAATIGVALSAAFIGAAPALAVNSNWSCATLSPLSGGSVTGTGCFGSGTGTGWFNVAPNYNAVYRCSHFTATPDSSDSYYRVVGTGCITA